MKHPVSGQGGIRWTARIGYAARGLFYLLGGLFSPLAGAGPGVEFGRAQRSVEQDHWVAFR